MIGFQIYFPETAIGLDPRGSDINLRSGLKDSPFYLLFVLSYHLYCPYIFLYASNIKLFNSSFSLKVFVAKLQTAFFKFLSIEKYLLCLTPFLSLFKVR
jgi:hypothetical protein